MDCYDLDTVILTSGGASAVAMADQSPIFGLLERITILTSTLWAFVVGRKLGQIQETTEPHSHLEIVGSSSKGK